jgi:hypothetical protein
VPWDVLDVIMEYAPGGSRAACDNLFVGSSNLKWSGPGSKYWTGVQDPQFRTAALEVVNEYARLFHDRYRGRYYHFYVDFEAVCNWWTDPGVRSGYVDLLSRWENIYEDIQSGRSMLYAPAYWSLPVPDRMETSVFDLFQRVRANSRASRGINWVTFQDMFGRKNSWLDPTPETTLAWYRLFKNTDLFDSVRVTPELFETTATTYGTGDAGEVASRLTRYDELHIPIGHMFELRYWYRIMQEWGGEPGVEPPPPEDKPAYMTSHVYKPGDVGWEHAVELTSPVGDVVEVTVIGLHDD